jgi:hypothetical protein
VAKTVVIRRTGASMCPLCRQDATLRTRIGSTSWCVA